MRPFAARLRLYAGTVVRLKPSQILHRLGRYVGLGCTIGCAPCAFSEHVHSITPLPELDFDSEFLARFTVEELMCGTFSFLHVSHAINVNETWESKEETPLWNFNLHYFEYLLPLWHAFKTSGEKRFLDRAVLLIDSWIRKNPIDEQGIGWAAYAVSQRVTNWLSFYAYADKELSEPFQKEMIRSLYEQYKYLSSHLEKDILGNHYFEDLKALMLCAAFFHDEKMLTCAGKAFSKECREEILPDGMHFELSPMYHNLILEGLLRVTIVLRERGKKDTELEGHIQRMLNAAWSLEESLDRIPLFNDSGNNVAKCVDALVLTAEMHLGLEPVFSEQLPDAGYYIFKRGKWKMIVDAGQPGPSYIPGHAHCDALSFELYRDGEPVVVNCGTYAYQSDLRDFFRSTAAHNTVMINGIEQSKCWGTFRMAQRSSVRIESVGSDHLTAEMQDQTGQSVKRTFLFGKELMITDETSCGTLNAFLHLLLPLKYKLACESWSQEIQPYAPEYGTYIGIKSICYVGKGRISLRISMEDE